MQTAWDLAEAAADDDEAPKKFDSPLLKPTAGPKPGERPTSMSPSQLGVNKAAIAAKEPQRTDVAPGAVTRVPKSASTLAKMGVSQKKYFSDDDPASAVQRQLRAGGKKPEREPVAAQKPGYAGSVPGQVYSRTGPRVSKPVSWTDKPSGEKKFGAVQASSKADEMVWDGSEWVSPREYTQRMWAKRMGRGAKGDQGGGSGKKDESMASAWDVLVEAMTPVKPTGIGKGAYLPGVDDPNDPARPGSKKQKAARAQAAGQPQKPVGEDAYSDVDEANWDKINKQKNMQTWGTQDRRADSTVATNRLQKALAQKRAAKAGAAATAPAPGALPPQVGANPIKREPLPPKPKTSFAGDDGDDDVRRNSPLMRPSRESIERILNMPYGRLVAECECMHDRAAAPVWDLAMVTVDDETPVDSED